MKKTIVLGSMDVARLVGIQPTLLNKFIERKQYGIEASVRPGKGRGKERLFSQEDVFGVALVYWLFESGLRSDSIQFVLNQICDRSLNSSANDAASRLLDRKAEVLAVTRQPRISYAEHPEQTTQSCDMARAVQLVRGASTRSVLVIPVGSLFASLRKAMGGN